MFIVLLANLRYELFLHPCADIVHPAYPAKGISRFQFIIYTFPLHLPLHQIPEPFAIVVLNLLFGASNSVAHKLISCSIFSVIPISIILS